MDNLGQPKPRHQYVLHPQPGRRGILVHTGQYQNGAPYVGSTGGMGMGMGMTGYGGMGMGMGMGYPGVNAHISPLYYGPNVSRSTYSNYAGFMGGYTGLSYGVSAYPSYSYSYPYVSPYASPLGYGCGMYANYYHPYQRTYYGMNPAMVGGAYSYSYPGRTQLLRTLRCPSRWRRRLRQALPGSVRRSTLRIWPPCPATTCSTRTVVSPWNAALTTPNPSNLPVRARTIRSGAWSAPASGICAPTIRSRMNATPDAGSWILSTASSSSTDCRGTKPRRAGSIGEAFHQGGLAIAGRIGQGHIPLLFSVSSPSAEPQRLRTIFGYTPFAQEHEILYFFDT
jgi:hypothetical protein